MTLRLTNDMHVNGLFSARAVVVPPTAVFERNFAPRTYTPIAISNLPIVGGGTAVQLDHVLLMHQHPVEILDIGISAQISATGDRADQFELVRIPNDPKMQTRVIGGAILDFESRPGHYYAIGFTEAFLDANDVLELRNSGTTGVGTAATGIAAFIRYRWLVDIE